MCFHFIYPTRSRVQAPTESADDIGFTKPPTGAASNDVAPHGELVSNDVAPHEGPSFEERQLLVRNRWAVGTCALYFPLCIGILVINLTSDEPLDTSKFLPLALALFFGNFLSAAIFFTLVRFWLLSRTGFSWQEIVEVSGDRTHLPSSWLPELLERPGVKKKIKVIDAFCRKGIHIWRNCFNYLIVVPFVAKDNTRELAVVGFVGVTLIGIASTVFYVFFPSNRYPKLWVRFVTVIFSASDRIRDGRLAIINMMVAAAAGNLGLAIAYGGGTLLLPSEDTAPQTWRLATWMVSLPLTFGDALGEIIGTPFGRHTFAVRGMGEINRKSLEGCAAVFMGSFVPVLVVALTNDGEDGELKLATKAVLPLVVAVVVTLVETFSFRSTDNFTIPLFASIAVLGWYRAFGF